MPVGAVVTLATHLLAGLDKYERVLAAVTLADGRDVATVMIAGGWAAPWDGQGPKPVPVSPTPSP